jgi:hypothetical protein
MSFHLDFGQDGTYETEWTMGVDEQVAIDIYVSNVPEPGLQSMGFVLVYDPLVLEAISANVDSINWPVKTEDHATPGEIDMTGGRLAGGILGDDVKLGTVRFLSIGEGQTSLNLYDRDILEDKDLDCFVLENACYDYCFDDTCFTACSESCADDDSCIRQCRTTCLDNECYDPCIAGFVLDHEIPVDPVATISVTTVSPCPGDMDGDRDVDGRDLALFAAEYDVCTQDCAGDFSGDDRVDAADLPFVANNLGKTDCL